MRNIQELQAIVDSLESWVATMGLLASCPRPYNPVDKYQIVQADTKIERAFKLLKKEVAEGAKMASDYRYQALRFRDPKMSDEATAAEIILNGIVVQTNAQIEKFNSYLYLCEHHI